MKAVISGLLLTTATFSGVVAAERQPGHIEMNVWGVSKHLETAPYGEKWNETNPGVGMRAFFKNPTRVKGLETFVTVDYVDRNSTGGHIIGAGIGAQYPIVSTLGADLLVGGVAGITRYRNRWEKITYTNPSGFPFLAIRLPFATTTFGYVPKIRFNDQQTYTTVFMFLSIPISF